MASLYENSAVAAPALMVRSSRVHVPLHRNCFPADAPVLLQGLPSPRLLWLWLDVHGLGRFSSTWNYCFSKLFPTLLATR